MRCDALMHIEVLADHTIFPPVIRHGDSWLTAVPILGPSLVLWCELSVSEPAITIVVPTYNGASTLHETLMSLAEQTNHDFTVIYVDDGSRDQTIDLLCCALRPHDRLLQKPNSGLYATLNYTLERVETEWVAFLFQDDVLKPEYVQCCLDLVRKEGQADFIWFAIDTIDGGSRTHIRRNRHGAERVHSCWHGPLEKRSRAWDILDDQWIVVTNRCS